MVDSLNSPIKLNDYALFISGARRMCLGVVSKINEETGRVSVNHIISGRHANGIWNSNNFIDGTPDPYKRTAPNKYRNKQVAVKAENLKIIPYSALCSTVKVLTRTA